MFGVYIYFLTCISIELRNIYSLPIFKKIKLWGVDWGVNTKNYLKFIEIYKDL